ncbi:nuclear transport factor 2 family protein [Williamsia soli]|uniref:nuclear transport factor 2 family protein n=1 Tax=Williamsia soli TaxID=364929 RepID=UPI001A9FEC3F|nr:nuclear transport factor 2 family protein [Williamsia soli]
MYQEQTAKLREQRIQDYYDACSVQDWDRISAFLHPEIVFQVAGNEPTHSVEILQERVVKSLAVTGVTEMTMTVDQYIHDLDGEQCVAEITVRLKRDNGKSYEGPGCAVFHFDDAGLIAKYHAYTDEGDFWS